MVIGEDKLKRECRNIFFKKIFSPVIFLETQKIRFILNLLKSDIQFLEGTHGFSVNLYDA